MLYARVPTPWDPNEPPKNQIVSGAWGRFRWLNELEPETRVFFRFADRSWNIAFDARSQSVSWDLKPSCWRVLSEDDYFPPGLRAWLKGRCFMLLRFRGRGGPGAAAPGVPANGYVTEDGVIFYVAEDNSTFYVQES